MRSPLASSVHAPVFLSGEVLDDFTKEADVVVYLERRYVPPMLGTKGHFEYGTVMVRLDVGVKPEGPYVVGAWRSEYARTIDRAVDVYERLTDTYVPAEVLEVIS